MMCFYRCFAGALAPVRESRAILAHHLQSRPLRTIDDCQSHWASEQPYRSTARRNQSNLVICGWRWGIGNIHQTSILPQKLIADHKAQAPHSAVLLPVHGPTSAPLTTAQATRAPPLSLRNATYVHAINAALPLGKLIQQTFDTEHGGSVALDLEMMLPKE